MWPGRGRSYGFRGGMGFGFRGSSPPWPYVGRGRGGLPRCGYFLGGHARWTGALGYTGMIGEQELDSLKNEADATRKRLEEIEARMEQLGRQGES